MEWKNKNGTNELENHFEITSLTTEKSQGSTGWKYVGEQDIHSLRVALLRLLLVTNGKEIFTVKKIYLNQVIKDHQ